MENYEELPAEEKPKLTKQEKKLAKYKDDMDAISLDADTYKNGINEDRSCTDFFCLVVFGVFFVAMVAITGYTMKEGNVDKMVAPVDMHLNFCGFGDRAEYQKLYFAYEGITESADLLNKGICMKSCPARHAQIDTANVHPDDKTYINNYNDYYSGENSGAYASKSVIDYCIPVPSDFKEDRPDEVENVKQALAMMTQNGPGVLLNDLYLSSRAIYWSMATAFILCILYIYLMSIFAEYLAWGIVIITQIGLIAVTAGSFI